ncbi:hypothetical protein ABIF65_003680 [Bradyrhizobium japonicum]|jgi:hypothetical protein|uniref:Uncharacterized protein n=1 Tax=Bradyrhizobium japonicum TaxID=375 RepID=A0A0A3XHE7_BRAJP|nr:MULTISPECIES: hypothetical protein [Bradyrhizobium]KGT73735.1 hypothetical protein MA20_43100 [Bradyrhizobium japonicum]MBR0882190.1 hypothetical protein [Bradyrhizobium liaoningense]MBR0946394.1 hypothetical protein [Bradyrhizobium liaoningense]MBR1004831.1 hypothetical protein [Bradyrhizobium liaoningense]MBR1032859.1 hypothetical protein [Bradyrhizobium liaoningense]
MRHHFPFVLCLMAILSCLSGQAAAAPSDEVAKTVARGLSYFSAAERHFSISDQWQALSGETVVCARLDIPNGANGWTATSDFSMFFLSKGAIVNMVKDNTMFGCPNRSYVPLQPVSR